MSFIRELESWNAVKKLPFYETFYGHSKRASAGSAFVMAGCTCSVICSAVQVGSQMIRGISGGQKKRVTTGEMIVGPKRTLFMVYLCKC